MPLVSIVIPAYNEENFIAEVLRRIAEVPLKSIGFNSEILVIDDGSTDATAAVVEASSRPNIRLLRQPRNLGKGAAVQRGIKEAKGEWILIQDADLEYDPMAYLPMLQAIGSQSEVSVYGSRFLGQIEENGWLRVFPGRHPRQGLGPWAANVVLGLVTLLLYGRYITDNLTAYKIYPAAFVKSLAFTTTGFEGDHEITSRLLQARYTIKEIPIAYEPRSVEEGKKIRAIDGIIGFWTFVRLRFQ